MPPRVNGLKVTVPRIEEVKHTYPHYSLELLARVNIYIHASPLYHFILNTFFYRTIIKKWKRNIRFHSSYIVFFFLQVIIMLVIINKKKNALYLI